MSASAVYGRRTARSLDEKIQPSTGYRAQCRRSWSADSPSASAIRQTSAEPAWVLAADELHQRRRPRMLVAFLAASCAAGLVAVPLVWSEAAGATLAAPTGFSVPLLVGAAAFGWCARQRHLHPGIVGSTRRRRDQVGGGSGRADAAITALSLGGAAAYVLMTLTIVLVLVVRGWLCHGPAVGRIK